MAVSIIQDGAPVSDQWQVLKASISVLPTKDQAFAGSLIGWFEKHGSWSPKQQYWAGQLIKRAQGKPSDSTPSRMTEYIDGLLQVVKMFMKAAETLKRPKIRLQVNGQPLLLAWRVMKATGKPAISVSDGKEYGHGLWFGRIDQTGWWEHNSKLSDEQLVPVRKALQDFGENPEEKAAQYGKLTGNCCFCGKKLTDEHSTAVGYGPVCAGKYGLTAMWKSKGAIKVQEQQETA